MASNASSDTAVDIGIEGRVGPRSSSPIEMPIKGSFGEMWHAVADKAAPFETFEACLFRALVLAISLIQPDIPPTCFVSRRLGVSICRSFFLPSSRPLDRSIDGGVTESTWQRGSGGEGRGGALDLGPSMHQAAGGGSSECPPTHGPSNQRIQEGGG